MLSPLTRIDLLGILKINSSTYGNRHAWDSDEVYGVRLYEEVGATKEGAQGHLFGKKQ